MKATLAKYLMVKSSEIGDFEPAWWQHYAPRKRAAWLRGYSVVRRAARKQVSSSEGGAFASCSSAKTGAFSML